MANENATSLATDRPSDPLISPEEKCTIKSDKQNNGVHMPTEFEEVENQITSRKMGAGKGGKSPKMCFNSSKEPKNGAKKEEYRAASFREMVRKCFSGRC